MSDVKSVLVTGTTSGIGEALAVRLARDGADVIGVARDPVAAAAATDRIARRVPGARVEMLAADLADLDQVRALAVAVRERRATLDALVLNAALARPDRAFTAAGHELHFAVNHLAAHLLTRELEPLLRAGAPARIVASGSSVHRRVTALDVEQLAAGLVPQAYAASKLCTVLFVRELARRLAGTGVTANVADPGFVRTGLGRHARGTFRLLLAVTRPFQVGPDAGADTAHQLVTAPRYADVTGGYHVGGRLVAPSRLAADGATAARLWDVSETLLRTVNR